MGPKTRALLWCLFLLLAAEGLLRGIDRPPDAAERLVTTQRLALALGTSRSMRALDPEVIDNVLRNKGITDVFAANISFKAVTNVGLLKIYLEQVRPRLPEGARGVLAIEVREEGFNDNYLLDDEDAWLDSAPAGDAGDALPRLAGLHPEGLARGWLSGLRLWHPAEIVTRWWSGDAEGGPPAWATGARGFLPFVNEPRFADLNVKFWKDHYEHKLLKDFRFGGVQTAALEQLIGLARADGLQPVLYTMPITDVQRGFFAPGDLQAALAHIRAMAEREQVPFIDLDHMKDVPAAMFQDTHHLMPAASRPVTTAFTRRVLVPLLGAP